MGVYLLRVSLNSAESLAIRNLHAQVLVASDAFCEK